MNPVKNPTNQNHQESMLKHPFKINLFKYASQASYNNSSKAYYIIYHRVVNVLNCKCKYIEYTLQLALINNTLYHKNILSK